MIVIRDIKKMQEVSARLKIKGRPIGFVPTMGALHEGHLSLIRRARKDNDVTVVSIFVNPAQFGPGEDLKKYPRPLKRDLALCRKEDVDFVFCPSVKDMYPKGFATFVEVEGLSGCMCGASRPGHFRGVATVVAKLINIVGCRTAYFGKKDAQQSIIIKKVVSDLNIPVKIVVLPTIREIDGLAMSSRNAYLNAQERQEALVLPQSLRLAQVLIKSGARDARKIKQKVRELIEGNSSARVDYIAIVDPGTLAPLRIIRGCALVALAARFGNARLIDNIEVRSKNA